MQRHLATLPIYHRSELPNESSISYRSFRRMFEKKAAWQRSWTSNKRVDSGDIEGRQKEKNRTRSTVRFGPKSDKVEL